MKKILLTILITSFLLLSFNFLLRADYWWGISKWGIGMEICVSGRDARHCFYANDYYGISGKRIYTARFRIESN